MLDMEAHPLSVLLFEVPTGVVADRNINMSALSTGKRDRYNILPVYMTIEIPDLRTLTRILAKFEQIPNVIEARRTV